MNVLVTGANGFIGQAIVFELFRNSHEVFAVGRSNAENQNQNLVKSENYFRADIADRNEIRNIKPHEQLEAVIHCAGLAHQFGKFGKGDFWQANVTGTENVAKLAGNLGVKHFILISSVSVYGGNFVSNEAVRENFECRPQDFYAQSKLEAERIAENILAEKGIKLTILRPATVIGEGDRGNFIRLIRAIDKKRFIWIGKGLNRKSLIHKNDVARACIGALKKASDQSEIFNVAAEHLTMKEIVEEIAYGLKERILPLTIPIKLLNKIFELNSQSLKNERLKGLEKTVNKWIAEDIYSSEKIRNRLGFVSEITVKDAILQEVKWYSDNKLSR